MTGPDRTEPNFEHEPNACCLICSFGGMDKSNFSHIKESHSMRNAASGLESFYTPAATATTTATHNVFHLQFANVYSD